ncbi:lipid-A-disaccharide synthase [Verrucomicrobiaceae bacterium 5K15]|uniref:Lipid-A-disaccharide synthase n=1 Tax=Oceaniferula flava TaxID=2800421 RepID=A0AAE2S9B0_9BACT|nr:lipid-A-disaccharide synthase [Oceaniferula flavus]MBM1134851.1 lipid-A-disaccharide synthase [Oceaniferula flavus]
MGFEVFSQVATSASVSQSIYIVAGEVSGDTHGACLMSALQEQLPEVVFHGAGGPEMQAVSEHVTNWVEDAAVMGIVEVLKHYKWFKQRFDEMLRELVALKPDVLVLIDYPGFNLRFATAVREQLPDTKIVYYISPQVWAWNKGRIPKMAATLDLMLCIFPFEQEIFQSAGLKTVFTGHPLVDELEEKKIDVPREDGLVGLFPGSREREVARLFPLMVETARRMHVHHPEWTYEAAAASEKLAASMREIVQKSGLADTGVIKIGTGTSHALMQRATCGVVASGTATLEAAALGLPYCLVYKVAWPTWVMGKLLVKVDFIGLVNILAGEKVVDELIQTEAEPHNLELCLTTLLKDESARETLRARLLDTASRLGEPGAHDRAAAEIAKLFV